MTTSVSPVYTIPSDEDWRRGGAVLRHACQLPHGCIDPLVDLITCSNVDILVMWEMFFCYLF